MKILLPIFFIAGGFLFSSCSSATFQSSATATGAAISRAEKTTPVAEALDNEQRAEAFARFATGNSYELNDQTDLALKEYHQAALADPANELLVLDLSRRYLLKKDTDKAIEVLSKSAARPQASGKIYGWLARSFLVSGKTNLALNAARSAIKKSPDSIPGYQTLTEIFLQSGQTNHAINLLNNAALSTNTNVVFLVSLAELYRNIPDTRETAAARQKGLEILTRASAMNVANPNLRQSIADLFADFGETKKAAEIYVQLLDEFHDVELMRDAIREKLANLYLRGRDRAKATEQLEAVVRDSPTRYPEAWYYLGAFAYDARDYAKAEEYFQRALIVNPEFEQAYCELAGVQINTDHAGEALKTLERAREKFPKRFGVEFFTGLAYSRLKNYTEAVKHFSAAEMIGNTDDPKRLNHLFYFQIGAACERKGDYGQAERYFQKCLELAPDFPDALNYLGFMWADRGEKLEQARKLIEKAVTLEPRSAAYADSLGWVLFKLKQNEQALAYLLKAVALSEEPDAAIFDHVGDVYRALKQNEKAREAWQKSLSLEPNDDVRKKLQTDSSAL